MSFRMIFLVLCLFLVSSEQHSNEKPLLGEKASINEKLVADVSEITVIGAEKDEHVNVIEIEEEEENEEILDQMTNDEIMKDMKNGEPIFGHIIGDGNNQWNRGRGSSKRKRSLGKKDTKSKQDANRYSWGKEDIFS